MKIKERTIETKEYAATLDSEDRLIVHIGRMRTGRFSLLIQSNGFDVDIYKLASGYRIDDPVFTLPYEVLEDTPMNKRAQIIRVNINSDQYDDVRKALKAFSISMPARAVS